MSRISWGYPILVVTGVVAPSRPGDPAPELEAPYRTAQSQADSTDVDRIKVAIQVYFDLKAQSLVRGRALDPGFVIDRSSGAGEDLYNYELGLLQYCLTLWE
jgi:hypothetical protein